MMRKLEVAIVLIMAFVFGMSMNVFAAEENGFKGLQNTTGYDENEEALLEQLYELCSSYSGMSWEDAELEAANMQNMYMSNSNYGKSIAYSSAWYNECMDDVEIIARLIYGENTIYYSDQIGVAYVLMNRVASSTDFDGDGSSTDTLKGVAIYPNAFEALTGSASRTVNARTVGEYIEDHPNDTSAYNAWSNATFLACLLKVTMDKAEWSVIVGNISGIGNQCYFVGYQWAMNNDMIRDNDGQLQYCMDDTWRNIYSVGIAGQGYLYTKAQIIAAAASYSNLCNIFFNL